MNAEAIRKRLQQLDPKNDLHWTDDGFPRLDAIGPGVTRAQVVAAQPGFSRPEDASQKLPPTPEAPVTEDAPVRFLPPVEKEPVLTESQKYQQQYRAWADSQTQLLRAKLAQQKKLEALMKEAGMAVAPKKSPLDQALAMRRVPQRPVHPLVGDKGGK